MSEYLILNSGAFTAEIDSVGAQCMNLYAEEYGISVLHTDALRVVTGIPILFPTNRIDGGHFFCEGVEYQLPVNEADTNCSLHGTLYEQPFTVVEQTATSVVLRWRSGGDYFGFSQDFSVQIGYDLNEGALTQTVVIENHAGAPLPILLGFHTAFTVPFCDGSVCEDVRIYADHAAALSRNERHLTDGRMPFDAEDEAFAAGTFCADHPLTRLYLAGEGGEWTMRDIRTGVMVCYQPDPAFTYRMIYSPVRGMFCCEPQTCAVDAPNLPADSPDAKYPILREGEQMVLRSVITVGGIGL